MTVTIRDQSSLDHRNSHRYNYQYQHGNGVTEMALSTRKILNKIGCDKLELVKGEGYWYFIYDDKTTGKYDTHSIMEMYLGQDKHLGFWVQEGKDFVTKMENAPAVTVRLIRD